jgi:Zn-dependent protease with chaperone function
MSVPPAQASAWIHNPLSNLGQPRTQAEARARAQASRFSTHPATEERIRRLRSREWVR